MRIQAGTFTNRYRLKVSQSCQVHTRFLHDRIKLELQQLDATVFSLQLDATAFSRCLIETVSSN